MDQNPASISVKELIAAIEEPANRSPLFKVLWRYRSDLAPYLFNPAHQPNWDALADTLTSSHGLTNDQGGELTGPDVQKAWDEVWPISQEVGKKALSVAAVRVLASSPPYMTR